MWDNTLYLYTYMYVCTPNSIIIYYITLLYYNLFKYFEHEYFLLFDYYTNLFNVLYIIIFLWFAFIINKMLIKIKWQYSEYIYLFVCLLIFYILFLYIILCICIIQFPFSFHSYLWMHINHNVRVKNKSARFCATGYKTKKAFVLSQ